MLPFVWEMIINHRWAEAPDTLAALGVSSCASLRWCCWFDADTRALAAELQGLHVAAVGARYDGHSRPHRPMRRREVSHPEWWRCRFGRRDAGLGHSAMAADLGSLAPPSSRTCANTQQRRRCGTLGGPHSRQPPVRACSDAPKPRTQSMPRGVWHRRSPAPGNRAADLPPGAPPREAESGAGGPHRQAAGADHGGRRHRVAPSSPVVGFGEGSSPRASCSTGQGSLRRFGGRGSCPPPRMSWVRPGQGSWCNPDPWGS